MKIAVLCGPRQFEIIDEPLPEIQPDELLVRAACGVCASELEPWMVRTAGIEYRATGARGERRRREGRRGGIRLQTRGSGRCVGDGAGFAEYVAVKARYCFPAGDVPLDEVLAEPLACAVNAVELANLSLSDDIVIIGAGFMGNLVQKLVALQGRVTLSLQTPARMRSSGPAGWAPRSWWM